MFTSCLAFALTLSLPTGTESQLEITDLRFTYGLLGAKRPKAEFLPGDKVFLAYKVKNMKLDSKGRALYSLSMKILDPTGQVRNEQLPENKVAINYLGGNLMPSAFKGDIPLDIPPGTYTIVLTLTDRLSKQTAEAKIQGKALPMDFGIIHVEPSGDPLGQVPTPPLGVLGEVLYVNFATVGFARDEKSKQPHLKVSLRLLDENGEATMKEPLMGEVPQPNESLPESLKIIPLQFAFTMNRTGNFTVELNAKDQLTGKTSQVTFPLTVLSLE